jgi:hypothetical protein
MSEKMDSKTGLLISDNQPSYEELLARVTQLEQQQKEQQVLGRCCGRARSDSACSRYGSPRASDVGV